MSAAVVLGLLLIGGVVLFLAGEQYGRAQERRVRERMRDRQRVETIEETIVRPRTLREISWYGPGELETWELGDPTVLAHLADDRRLRELQSRTTS